MRRRLAPMPLALLGILALASGAVAGGGAQVTLTDSPVEPSAGVGTPIGFWVMQHGQTAVSWPRITVVATDADSGVVVRAARPKGRRVCTSRRSPFRPAGTGRSPSNRPT
jgi:hypothetical protein